MLRWSILKEQAAHKEFELNEDSENGLAYTFCMLIASLIMCIYNFFKKKLQFSHASKR